MGLEDLMSLDGGNHVFACVLCVCVCVDVAGEISLFILLGDLILGRYISCCEKMEEINLLSRREKSLCANIYTHPLFCSPKE